MYYAPSMRNGTKTGDAAEDRGNAVLSSLPLSDIEAIELPFVVQRRVALTATVTDPESTPLMRVAVAHFDTRAPFFKGWIFGGPGARNTQAASVASILGDMDNDGLPVVLGGDLNTMFGARESSVKTVSSVIERRECGADSTHTSGFALDHIFASIPTSWSEGACARVDDTFGSDHYPLVLPLATSPD
jgi:endonuclease/exonuclease/phosphatase family metal-dependent hydrolase